MTGVVLVDRAVQLSPLREPWLRSCWVAARADNLHAAAIEAMEEQLATAAEVGRGGWERWVVEASSSHLVEIFPKVVVQARVPSR